MDSYRSVFWNKRLSLFEAGFIKQSRILVVPDVQRSFLGGVVLLKGNEKSSIPRKFTLDHLINCGLNNFLGVYIFRKLFGVVHDLREAVGAHIRVSGPKTQKLISSEHKDISNRG